MKGALLFFAIFAVALLIVPMIALSFDRQDAADTPAQVHAPPQLPSSPAPPQNQDMPAASTPAAASQPEEEVSQAASGNISANGVTAFKILDTSTGKVVTVPLRDYIRGAVAAEMPASFHPEAMKAQAVAAHTFALHNHLVQQKSPDPALKGADFSADPSKMQVYITEETARNFYGEMADVYWDKICTAADAVLPYVMEYDDEPIVAAYHAISAGQTEDAANVWTGSAPYLQASDSEGDRLAPDYETTLTLSRDQVKTYLATAYPSAKLPDDPGAWFSGIERSESGYITQVDVGGVSLHGKDIRTLFDLRSHNIEIAYNDSNGYFTFRVYGYGHGVGLSQYGADFMARQGSTFDEILRNYYTGVTLKQISLENAS